MAPKPVAIDRFPGLDLRQDATEWPGAVDCLNVDFEPGRIKTRPGLDSFWAGSDVIFLFAYEWNGEALIAVTDTTPANLHAIDSTPPVISTTTPTATPFKTSAAAIGTPLATYVYVQSGGVIRRWAPATFTWSAPAGMPATAGVLTTTATDNRLVVCSNGADSKVSFSDAGAPETFGVNNYVQLRPGDGEGIAGATVFNNQTFIFKSTKFFVFYGQSVDSTGQPIFNYRTVEGVGLHISQSQGVCTGPDGVYFFGEDGIYRTTGGPPQRISDPLRPFFTGREVPSYWQGGVWNKLGQYQTLKWYDGALYAVVSRGAGNPALLVFDPAINAWSFWEIGARTLATVGSGVYGAQQLFLGTAAGISRLDPDSIVDDAGAAITSRYRSGFMDMGAPGLKTIRDTIVEGVGIPTLKWSVDYGTLNTGSPIVLGTAPATDASRQSYAVQGRRFSYQLGASGGAWAVNYLQPNVIAERPGYVA
jgi:hypothetical protein